jgi:hypothetical protein
MLAPLGARVNFSPFTIPPLAKFPATIRPPTSLGNMAPGTNHLLRTLPTLEHFLCTNQIAPQLSPVLSSRPCKFAPLCKISTLCFHVFTTNISRKSCCINHLSKQPGRGTPPNHRPSLRRGTSRERQSPDWRAAMHWVCEKQSEDEDGVGKTATAGDRRSEFHMALLTPPISRNACRRRLLRRKVLHR